MRETLERICDNISKLETRINEIEDDLYHIRLEIETKIKKLNNRRNKKTLKY